MTAEGFAQCGYHLHAIRVGLTRRKAGEERRGDRGGRNAETDGLGDRPPALTRIVRIPADVGQVWVLVEGADRLRLNEEGEVREITVTGRPLSGVATFLSGIGPRFARRRKGGAVATALRVGARPLPPMLAVLDPVTRWLIRPGRRATLR